MTNEEQISQFDKEIADLDKARVEVRSKETPATGDSTEVLDTISNRMREGKTYQDKRDNLVRQRKELTPLSGGVSQYIDDKKSGKFTGKDI
ncbi:hypothetical protein JZU61_04150 [bacterium]|nr:hypothetical protein [bacterium]